MMGDAALPLCPQATSTGLREAVREAVSGEVEALRRFIDRRFSELSVEVHGAVQMVDFSEANLSEQLGRIRGQIAGLVAVPAAASRNSGLELEAVVQASEVAADRILEAAEEIASWVERGQRDPAGFALLTDKVNAIFEACSFHDLTGQRIRRAIDHLRHVENLLENLMGTAGVPGAGSPSPAGDSADLAQPEIDRLMG